MFFALNDAYRLIGIAGKQMLSKEHLFGILKLRSYMRTFTDGTHGVGPSLYPMTVIAIGHQLGIMHPLLFVYQPEHHCPAIIHPLHNDVSGSTSHTIIG